jgi:hypothetical protein
MLVLLLLLLLLLTMALLSYVCPDSSRITGSFSSFFVMGHNRSGGGVLARAFEVVAILVLWGSGAADATCCCMRELL